MTQKKKLNLKELELQLPPISLNETKIILGGNDYDGGPDINPNDPSWSDGQPMDYDPNQHFILVGGGNSGDNDQDQGDFDYYYDNDYDDGYPDGGGNGIDFSNGIPPSSSFNPSPALHDGLNSQVLQNIDFSQIGNSNSVGDIQALLMSNSELGSLLTQAMNNGITVSFDTKPMEFGSTYNTDGNPSNYVWGNTHYEAGNNHITINLNSFAFDANGHWNADIAGISGPLNSSDGVDTTGFNTLQDFTYTIAHEVVHTLMSSMFEKAWSNDHTIQGTHDYMVQNNYPADFISIYIVDNGDGTYSWRDADQAAALEHAYMIEHYSDTINNIVNEFTQDMHDLQHTVDNLRQAADFAWQEAHSTDPNVPDSWPTQSEWMAYYNDLQHQLSDIMGTWGVFIDKGF